MSRNNALYLLVGALIVVVGVLGYIVYQERQPPDTLRIELGPGGVSFDKK